MSDTSASNKSSASHDEARARRRAEHHFQNGKWYLGHFDGYKEGSNSDWLRRILALELVTPDAGGEQSPLEVEFQYTLSDRLEPGSGTCRFAFLETDGSVSSTRTYEVESLFTKTRELSPEEVVERLATRRAEQLRMIKLKQTAENLREFMPEALPALHVKYPKELGGFPVFWGEQR